jgi:hypothetical protein
MTISSVKTGVIGDSLLAGNASYDPSAMFLIQRITAVGGETSLSFTSIPSTYKSLQIRGISRASVASTGTSNVSLTLNSDTGSNYSIHRINTYDGNQINVQGLTPYPYIFLPAQPNDSTTANCFMSSIIDLIDYASTTKNKTVRIFGGADTNATDATSITALISGGWYSLSAVTSLQVKANTSSFKAGTTFALYGMVG